MQKDQHEILENSHHCFQEWQHASIEDRCNAVRQWATKITEHKNIIAQTITEEIKKPIKESRAEISKCIDAMHWFADAAASHSWQKNVTEGAIRATPFGPILGIMPFNFPCWQTIRFMIPTLLSGCTVIIRPPEYGKKSISYIIKLAHTLPEYAISTISAPRDTIHELIKDPRICGVSFTGSTRVGSIIGEYCGSAIKPAILELGGNDAYIICADADLPMAARKIVASRLRNSGQACNAAKRIIVTPTIEDDFVAHLVTVIKTVQYGPLMDDKTDIGPLVSEDAFNRLEHQVNQSIKNGAKIIYKSPMHHLPNFYPPTILHHRSIKEARNEEFFGPVFSLYTCPDQDSMITLANQTDFGLCSGVFTQNKKLAEKIMRQLQSGQVCHNQCFSSSPHLPFTGIKSSGVGTECSETAFDNFTFPKLYRF